MTIEWYTEKFSHLLPVKSEVSKFYNPSYKPVLPVYKRNPPQIGK